MPATARPPQPINVTVTLKVQLTADQAAAYALEYGLGDAEGNVTAMKVSGDIRRYIHNMVQNSPGLNQEQGCATIVLAGG